jgi:hypothetical protein
MIVGLYSTRVMTWTSVTSKLFVPNCPRSNHVQRQEHPD